MQLSRSSGVSFSTLMLEISMSTTPVVLDCPGLLPTLLVMIDGPAFAASTRRASFISDSRSAYVFRHRAYQMSRLRARQQRSIFSASVISGMSRRTLRNGLLNVPTSLILRHESSFSRAACVLFRGLKRRMSAARTVALSGTAVFHLYACHQVNASPSR